jgi:hypothetical protein
MKRNIKYKDKIITLIINDNWEELDVDNLTKIDYSNITGEIFTSHIMLNRVGLLKSEIENKLREANLHADTLRARFSHKWRKKNTYEEYNSARKMVKKKPTIGEVDDALNMDKEYINAKKDIMELENDLSIVDNIYWACKSKDDKVKLFERHLTPEDMEMDKLESSINGVLIRANRSKLHN